MRAPHGESLRFLHEGRCPESSRGGQRSPAAPRRRLGTVPTVVAGRLSARRKPGVRLGVGSGVPSAASTAASARRRVGAYHGDERAPRPAEPAVRVTHGARPGSEVQRQARERRRGEQQGIARASRRPRQPRRCRCDPAPRSPHPPRPEARAATSLRSLERVGITLAPGEAVGDGRPRKVEAGSGPGRAPRPPWRRRPTQP